MRLQLPQVCAVLAHELRTPLSVLQGYIRLLQRNRREGDPEGPMLAAMLDATGKLSGIARQASELGIWMQSPAATGAVAFNADAVAATLTRLNERHQLTMDSALQASPVLSSDDGESRMLASAILAVCDGVARDAGAPTADVRVYGANVSQNEALAVEVRPSGAPSKEKERTAADRKPLFSQGGLGLALVTASHVLDAYRGSLERDDAAGVVRLSFPLEGGIAP